MENQMIITHLPFGRNECMSQEIELTDDKRYMIECSGWHTPWFTSANNCAIHPISYIGSLPTGVNIMINSGVATVTADNVGQYDGLTLYSENAPRTGELEAVYFDLAKAKAISYETANGNAYAGSVSESNGQSVTFSGSLQAGDDSIFVTVVNVTDKDGNVYYCNVDGHVAAKSTRLTTQRIAMLYKSI